MASRREILLWSTMETYWNYLRPKKEKPSMPRIPKQAVTCITSNIRLKHTGKSTIQLASQLFDVQDVNELSLYLFTLTVWMLQRKRTVLEDSSTTVKLETAKQSFTPLTKALIWSWWHPETSKQTRNCCMTMAIAVRPRFWLILGSNSESTNVASLMNWFILFWNIVGGF